MEKIQLLTVLRRSVRDWNQFRQQGAFTEELDLRDANLSNLVLDGADLKFVDLSGATLVGSDLRDADLSYTDLKGTNLARARLDGAKFIESNCDVANFTQASLMSAIFSDTPCRSAQFIGADLTDAYFGGCDCTNAAFDQAGLQLSRFNNTTLINSRLLDCRFSETILTSVNLSEAVGLDSIRHEGCSMVDFRTLQRSGPLPKPFLQGVGFPDRFIDDIASFMDGSIQFSTCFISYSSKDSMFAHKLLSDLQSKGIRCWFAPHDLPVGAKIWDTIDKEIRLRDKLIVILSRNSIISDWVEDEVNKAFAEERRRNAIVLLPIRIDQSIFQTNEPWAQKVKDQRNIGDFRKFKDVSKYDVALERLIKDLHKSR